MHVGDFFPFPLDFLLLPADYLPKLNNLLCSTAAAAAVETTLDDDVEIVRLNSVGDVAVTPDNQMKTHMIFNKTFFKMEI